MEAGATIGHAGERMRPRMLFVSHMVPFPEYSGAASRTLNLVRQLAQGFDVHVLPFFRRPQHSTGEEAAAAAGMLRKEGWSIETPSPVPSDWSRPRRSLIHLRAALTRRSYGPIRFESPDFTRRVHGALSAGADLVHIDTLDLCEHVEGVDVPVVINYHDVDSAYLQRRADHEANPLMKTYVRRQARAYAALERRWAASCALNIVCSEKERLHLERLAPSATVGVVPNGVDTSYFRPMAEPAVDENAVLFVGGLDMNPNADGLRYFLDSAWPLIRARGSGVRLHVVGKAPESAVASFGARDGVTFEGRVPDIRPHLARAAVVIVPLRLGGGTRLKIVHAWAMEKAIVSTSVGAEGLAAADGENILIRDDPAGFAEGVLELLRDRQLRCRLGTAAARTVADLYDWEVIGAHARDLYGTILERSGA